MPEDVYMQFINGNIVESAASTLTEQELPPGILDILTGCTVAGMIKNEAIGMEVREIILQKSPITPTDSPSAGTHETITFALSTESGLAAMPNISDVHCIYLHESALRSGVATYLPLVMDVNGYPPAYQWASPLLIPHPKIYAYVLSSNASQVQRVYYRVGFTYVRLTGPEVMEALEITLVTRCMEVSDSLEVLITNGLGGIVAKEVILKLVREILAWVKAELCDMDHVHATALEIRGHSEAITAASTRLLP